MIDFPHQPYSQKWKVAHDAQFMMFYLHPDEEAIELWNATILTLATKVSVYFCQTGSFRPKKLSFQFFWEKIAR